jgi:hypothetical protein
VSKAQQKQTKKRRCCGTIFFMKEQQLKFELDKITNSLEKHNSLKGNHENTMNDQTLDLEVSNNEDNAELENNLIKLNDSKIESSIMDSECN